MRNLGRFIIHALVLAGLVIAFSRPVFAIDIPQFPSCTSPSGSVKVSYSSGVHGIPGDAGQYVGSDVVYTVSNSQLVQCFCAATGAGIQTNWWKQDSLSQDQIDQLTKLGWIVIPDGSAWGLDPVSYLAQNSNFNCGGGGESGFSQAQAGPAPVCDSAKPGTPASVSVNRSGSTATLSWSTVPNASHYTIGYGLKTDDYIYGVSNTGNVTTYTIGSLDPSQSYYFALRAVNNCMPGDWATPSQATGGQVLGLASTGSLAPLLTLILLGLSAGVLAMLFRRPKQSA
ncbi:hypothetical protein A2634_05135 [Candidatus Amesbacteria bacterium RIFCSPHIGHO2_01_FULL_48_32]|uniref:Fibronectin type-III domain-containing protein n=1 Tax=Candidatus Amesbacteria bacterium RIFCSPLOWO2_01_FULL_48_25 TaxID=1797259 RepID=A0A1F4ZCL7_9BACT|nr:MAG: hypothetical protein A2634_05135 [Candidatus Amesbacteria bacterium RIFCSPHIGHO2_01_FULL_48_32]OGD04052.1 MAG: hypothetical protein A2989_01480 [Candidatus Amesbacteria bacterium RIFCSPLOWO2_01_FULL_48_25]HJZ05684.1 fibronectin type III domain-containing protein [Patescibacteria group bacterium]